MSPVYVSFIIIEPFSPKSLKDEVADDAGKKSTEVLRKDNEVQDPAKEGDKNNQEKDVRDQEEAPRKQFKQESKRLFGQGEAANTNSTNILNTVSLPVNDVSSSFTTVDRGRERTQRNKFENLPTDPLMPNLEDTADTEIFSGAYDDEVEGEEADFSNLELTTVVSPKSLKDEVADDAGKKSTEVLRKDNEVQDPAKEGDKNNQEKDVRDQEEAPRKQFKQESKRLFGQGEAANTNSTNILNTVSLPVNDVSSSFTTVDRGRERTQRNKFENLPTDPLMPNLEDTADTEIFSGAYDDEVEGEEADFSNLELTTVKVWRLVDLPKGKHAIRTKWVYRNKKDERGIVVRNKARLVAQGYTQEEGIDYDEVFAPVPRIEAIWLFLAYASFMGFIVYQIDVKSAFLYGTIEKEIQDKYVADILKKFDFSLLKTTSTPIETNKALLKDEKAVDVDVYLYRSMIRSLMYFTASRPDIMFVVCACARFQVTPKVSHLHAIKRIYRHLKGQPKLGLWYPRDSPFNLEAFSDGDYAGASLDKKSITRGCQFLGKRLISWQCKKQTVVSNSTTEAEYVAATNCSRQVLWIQNQMLDYGFNFMNTKIYIDNESTICIVKNPVYHSKTKHIEIRHHFIRDSYEKRLIQVIKIHINHNVADLLTKMAFVMDLEFQLVAAMDVWIRMNQQLMLKSKVESSEDKESLGDQDDASKHMRIIDNIDQDAEIILVDETQRRMNEDEMFGVNDLDGDEVIVDATAGKEVEHNTKVAKKEVNTADPVATADELTLDQTLIEIKAAKPKARGVIAEEPSEFRTISSSQPSQLPQANDKEVARKLEAQLKVKMQEEERIAKEKDEENIAVIEQWDEVQAKINVDMELA
uniref:Putative ribonuclease H-like domain-containing protein n=1 Tax=Tanacetum cinerariifolium TaxID=118510 RepID=A0A6L2KXW9_TANCI|nr:putative ribonuclease H-like domain-containing protein [Tanacetum cinerariifolium]